MSYPAPKKPPIQQQISLKLEDSTGIECEGCGGMLFTESLLLRKWSKLLTGTPEDYVQPVPCFTCSVCGIPLKQFFPKGMKDVEAIFNLIEKEKVTSNLLIGGM